MAEWRGASIFFAQIVLAKLSKNTTKIVFMMETPVMIRLASILDEFAQRGRKYHSQSLANGCFVFLPRYANINNGKTDYR